MSAAIRLFTRMRGRLVGTDDQGNQYYTERTPVPGRRGRRWVVYNGEPEASRVPPEWHAWLHWLTDDAPLAAGGHAWQRPHRPNRTGTPRAHVPRGHTARGGARTAATGDYEPWRPE